MKIQLLLNKGMAKFAAQRKLLKHRASRSGFRARKCSRIERKRAWGWGVWEEGSWEIGKPGEWGGGHPTIAGCGLSLLGRGWWAAGAWIR